MSDNIEPDIEQQLRDALRALDEPSLLNDFARSSILAAVRDVPELYAASLEEMAYSQAELDLHLDPAAEGSDSHTTRADWLGRFVARFSSAVNEVTKSLAGVRRNTPGLQVLAPSMGSVRVVLRAPLPEVHEGQARVAGSDDTTVESRALEVVTSLFKMAERSEDVDESALPAAAQRLTPIARQRVRSVAKSVIDAGWDVEGTLEMKGRVLETLRVDSSSAARLYEVLNRTVVTTTSETLDGLIDGERRSLSAMWFVPAGYARPFEVSVGDDELMSEVRVLAAAEATVRCEFRVYLTVPAGASEATSRSRELVSIRAVPASPVLVDN